MNPPTPQHIEAFKTALMCIAMMLRRRNDSGYNRFTQLDPKILDAIADQIVPKNLQESLLVLNGFLQTLGVADGDKTIDCYGSLLALKANIDSAAIALVALGPARQIAPQIAITLRVFSAYLSDRLSSLASTSGA